MPSTNADPRALAKTRTQALAAAGARGVPPDAHKQVEAIGTVIADLLNADAAADDLLRSVLQYRAKIDNLRQVLNRRLVGLMLPANQEDTEFYEQCGQLYLDLAAVCQRIVREAPKEFEQNPQDLERVTQASYWALSFLGDRLHCAFCSYARAPAGIWLQIHQVYQYSLTHGLAKTAVRARTKLRHITHVYKRVLLFGICDPYQFPFSSVSSVFNALDDWAKLAHLRVGKPSSDKCLFLINPDSDRPAVPILPKLSLGVESLYLDTAPLVDALNLDLNTYDDIAVKNGMPHLHPELENRQMLKTLIVSWGVHPTRQAERERREDSYELVTGLNSVITLLDSRRGAGQCSLRTHQGLQLVDESTAGARICVKDSDETHVRVGELVAGRSQHEQNWSIGMIRWGQTDVDDRFYIGVYKFAGEASPVSISIDETSHGSTGPVNAILLTTTKAEERTPTLIISSRYYRPNGRIFMYGNGESTSFEPDKVILATRYFVWLNIASVAPRPKSFVFSAIPADLIGKSDRL